jgi:hypothetical protein
LTRPQVPDQILCESSQTCKLIVLVTLFTGSSCYEKVVLPIAIMPRMSMAHSDARRRLRFSLRTLLLLVAACAVATWVYVIGWPWLEQVRFERAVRQLKVGCTAYDACSVLPPTRGVTTTFSANARDQLAGLSRYPLSKNVYFIHYEYREDYAGSLMKCPSLSVAVFRLPHAPAGYKSKRKVMNYPGPPEQVGFSMANRAPPPSPEESPEQANADDFLYFVTGDRNDDFGLKPELIYSDPPSQTATK